MAMIPEQQSSGSRMRLACRGLAVGGSRGSASSSACASPILAFMNPDSATADRLELFGHHDRRVGARRLAAPGSGRSDGPRTRPRGILGAVLLGVGGGTEANQRASTRSLRLCLVAFVPLAACSDGFVHLFVFWRDARSRALWWRPRRGHLRLAREVLETRCSRC